MLTKLGIKGYTQINEVLGCGSKDGVPHHGTHTWPEINNALFTIVEDDMVDKVFNMIKMIDNINETVGIRAFVWDVTATI